MSGEPHELDRRDIFLRVVELQDAGVDLNESRRRIAGEYDIDTEEVCDIESEGLAKKWPPL